MKMDSGRLVLSEAVVLLVAIAFFGGIASVLMELVNSLPTYTNTMTFTAFQLLVPLGVVVILGYIYMESVGGFR